MKFWFLLAIPDSFSSGAGETGKDTLVKTACLLQEPPFQWGGYEMKEFRQILWENIYSGMKILCEKAGIVDPFQVSPVSYWVWSVVGFCAWITTNSVSRFSGLSFSNAVNKNGAYTFSMQFHQVETP